MYVSHHRKDTVELLTRVATLAPAHCVHRAATVPYSETTGNSKQQNSHTSPSLKQSYSSSKSLSAAGDGEKVEEKGFELWIGGAADAARPAWASEQGFSAVLSINDTADTGSDAQR